jgi:thiamine-phosphate pyrophosphorylase
MMGMKAKIQNWRLYLITDEQLSKGKSHLQIADAAIQGGADVIQLRDKSASSRELYDSAGQIRELTRKNKIPFILNDRLDIALVVQADGLHVGQTDLPVKVARKVLGASGILGVSAGSLQEAILAEQDGADYLGVGPVYEARGTKSDAGEPRGLALISQIRQHCRIPIIAIGGITPENANEVLRAGASGVAVISAIVAAPDILQATRDFKRRIVS